MAGAERILVEASLFVLREGSTGSAVGKVQALLNVVAGTALAEDGIFGRRTASAVTGFQASRHLVVDGAVGTQTWTALLAEPATTASIVVEQPQPYDIVDDPVLIAGIGRGFEGTITTRVRDASGTLLAGSFVQAGNFALANFQTRLAVGAVPPTASGTVELADDSGVEEGTTPPRVVVPVLFGRVLHPTYVGFHPHVVVAGETLSGMAQAFYGDASLFPRIFDANPQVLSDPDEILPGQVLRVPFGEDTVFPPGG